MTFNVTTQNYKKVRVIADGVKRYSDTHAHRHNTIRKNAPFEIARATIDRQQSQAQFLRLKCCYCWYLLCCWRSLGVGWRMTSPFAVQRAFRLVQRVCSGGNDTLFPADSRESQSVCRSLRRLLHEALCVFVIGCVCNGHQTLTANNGNTGRAVSHSLN